MSLMRISSKPFFNAKWITPLISLVRQIAIASVLVNIPAPPPKKNQGGDFYLPLLL